MVREHKTTQNGNTEHDMPTAFQLTADILNSARWAGYRAAKAGATAGTVTYNETFSLLARQGRFDALDEADDLTDSQWRRFCAAVRKGIADASL